MIKELVDIIRNNKDFSVESLHSIILSLGLNNEILHEQPPELAEYFGKGLKMWQYPNQLSKFANYIHNLNVSSYLEIGCRYGGTFIFNSEILSINNPQIKLFACDIIPMSTILTEYLTLRNFKYIHDSSTSSSFKDFCKTQPIELVFIDGDHSYNGVKNDFEIFIDSQETKYFVFHDISSDACPGVKQLWSEIKNDSRFETLEFCDQYDSVNGQYLGIGIATRL
jgi:cephalosporin hydroxylase